jgi:hypothetical protein
MVSVVLDLGTVRKGFESCCMDRAVAGKQHYWEPSRYCPWQQLQQKHRQYQHGYPNQSESKNG